MQSRERDMTETILSGHGVLLKEGDFLIVSIQSALSDVELSVLCMDVSKQLVQHHSRRVILDLSGLDVLDSFSTNTLQHLCQMLRLHGARTVVTGIQPEVAISMAMRGLDFGNIQTAVDLTDALSRMDSRNGPRI